MVAGQGVRVSNSRRMDRTHPGAEQGPTAESMGKEKLLWALTAFVLSEKLSELLGQKVKAGGKDTSPARTLYSAGKVACKSFNN